MRGSSQLCSTRFRLVAASLLVAAAVLAFPSAAFATRTLGLSTGKFEFTVDPGQSGSGEVYVTNDGTEPIKVLVYAANQAVDAKGVVSFATPSMDDPAAQVTPATWLQVQMPSQSKSIGNTPYFDLAPGQRVPVDFTFTVPPNVAPGDHQVLLFFEMFEMQGQSSGAISKLSGRLGTRLRIRVNGELIERMDVRPFVVPSVVWNGRMPWSFTIRNDGNVDERMSVTMSLLDTNEVEKLSSAVMSDTPVYARSQRETTGTANVGGLFGQYTMRVTAEYPGARSATESGAPKLSVSKDRTVWLIPLQLVVGAAVLILAIVAWVVWSRLKRAAKRRAEREIAAAAAAKDDAVA